MPEEPIDGTLTKKGIMEYNKVVNATLVSISNGNLSGFCSLKRAKSENKEGAS